MSKLGNVTQPISSCSHQHDLQTVAFEGVEFAWPNRNVLPPPSSRCSNATGVVLQAMSARIALLDSDSGTDQSRRFQVAIGAVSTLPNLSSLSSNVERKSETDAQRDASTDFSWFMPHFRVVSEQNLPPKSHPTSKQRVLYKTVECPYCWDKFDIKAQCFDSQIGKRIHAHLESCPKYGWNLQPLRRARARSDNRNACGREMRSMTQMFINSNGKLEHHEFGSLLRCLCKGKRALDQQALPTQKETFLIG